MSTILIGGGNSSFREWLEETLFAEDYQIEVAQSAGELIHKLLRRRFESVVLGTDITGMNLLEVIPIIKQINKNMPIVVIADYSSLETEREVRRQSIFYYSVKPIHADEMREVLRNAVRRERTVQHKYQQHQVRPGGAIWYGN